MLEMFIIIYTAAEFYFDTSKDSNEVFKKVACNVH